MTPTATATHTAAPTHLTLDTKRHVAFWLRHLRILPRAYTSADTQRMTIAYFALSALDLLGALDEKLPQSEREQYTQWIWAQHEARGGFRGGPATVTRSTIPQGHLAMSTHDTTPQGHGQGHLAMTYTALLSLALLRDDFARLDRPALMRLLAACQQDDGSFAPAPAQQECDPRFTFCAFAIAHMLQDWTAIDVPRALDFLDSCRSYDGAFGQGPHQESHGGSTYCAVAAYSLAGHLTARISPRDRQRLAGWLVARQSKGDLGGGGAPTERNERSERSERSEHSERNERNERSERSEHSEHSEHRKDNGAGTEGERGRREGGDSDDEDDDDEPTPDGAFNGRIAKPGDSCYSFWCGAALRILYAAERSESSGTPSGGGPQTPSSSTPPPPPLPPPIDARANAAHLLRLQTPIGGIPKVHGSPPDAMHSYLALAALALHGGEAARGGASRAGEPEEAEDGDADGWRQRSGIALLGLPRTRTGAGAGGEVGRQGTARGLDPRLNVSFGTAGWIAERVPAGAGGGGGAGAGACAAAAAAS